MNFEKFENIFSVLFLCVCVSLLLVITVAVKTIGFICTLRFHSRFSKLCLISCGSFALFCWPKQLKAGWQAQLSVFVLLFEIHLKISTAFAVLNNISFIKFYLILLHSIDFNCIYWTYFIDCYRQAATLLTFINMFVKSTCRHIIWIFIVLQIDTPPQNVV